MLLPGECWGLPSRLLCGLSQGAQKGSSSLCHRASPSAVSLGSLSSLPCLSCTLTWQPCVSCLHIGSPSTWSHPTSQSHSPWLPPCLTLAEGDAAPRPQESPASPCADGMGGTPLPPATARGVFHDGVTGTPVQYSYFTEPRFAATLLPPADPNGKSTYEVGLGCVCP